MTNYKKIQSMNIKELAEWLYKNDAVCRYIHFCQDKDCKTCIAKWLEEESEDEDY